MKREPNLTTRLDAIADDFKSPLFSPYTMAVEVADGIWRNIWRVEPAGWKCEVGREPYPISYRVEHEGVFGGETRYEETIFTSDAPVRVYIR